MTCVPVLDARVLGRLGEELGDPALLCMFLKRYADLLQARIERLQRALDAHDLADWHDAALSLRTSSTMTGAVALAQLVAELESTIEPPTLPQQVVWFCQDRIAALMAELHRLAEETGVRLRAFVELYDDAKAGQRPWSPT